jgi:hypothetical protein
LLLHNVCYISVWPLLLHLFCLDVLLLLLLKLVKLHGNNSRLRHISNTLLLLLRRLLPARLNQLHAAVNLPMLCSSRARPGRFSPVRLPLLVCRRRVTL